VAVVARVAIVFYAEHRPGSFEFPDSHRYVLVAQNIAAGRGPVESSDVRAGTDPLYPAILSIGVLLDCDDADAVMRFGRMVNAVLGVFSVALLAAFARRLVGDRPALIAAAILAVDPILLFFNALVLTETCTIALLLAGFYGMTRSGEERGWLWAAGAGLLLGLATITRSSGLFLPFVLVPFVGTLARRSFATVGRGGPTLQEFSAQREGRNPKSEIRNPKSKKSGRGPDLPALAACAAFLLATCAVLVPTIVRNHGLFGQFVPVRTGSGASLMEALGSQADGAPGMDRVEEMERIEKLEFPPDANEYVRDRIRRDAAVDWVRRHPREALSLAWVKLRRTWSVTINASDYASPFYARVAWLTVAPEFVLAACGVWVLRRRRGVVTLLLIVAIYFTLVHMVFVGSVRYRVPAMPFLFVLVGVAVDRLWCRIGRGLFTGGTPVAQAPGKPGG
jgi:hypothetical protein